MILTCPSQIESIHGQLDTAFNKGFSCTTVSLPVVEVVPLRIGLASIKSKYDSQDFTVGLSRHPSGIYSVGVESSYGLAMGTPVFFRDSQRETSCTETANFESMHLTVGRNKITGSTVDFDGNNEDLRGLSREGQELLVAQLAGLIIGRSLRGAA